MSRGLDAQPPSWEWIRHQIDGAERCQAPTCHHPLHAHDEAGCGWCSQSRRCQGFVLHKDLWCSHKHAVHVASPSGVTYARCRQCGAAASEPAEEVSA